MRILRISILLIVLLAIVWAAAKVDWLAIGRELGSASMPHEAAMAVAWAIALFIRPLRMLVLLRVMAAEVKRQYWPVYRADVIAMAMNSVIPGRAGDFMMAFVLRRSLGIRTARASSVVLVDRFLDFCTVVVVFVSMLSMAPTVAPWAQDLTTTLLMALILLLVALWGAVRLREVWIGVLDRLLARLVPKRAARWTATVHDLFGGLALIDKFGVIVAVVVLSICLWATITASYWFGIAAIWPNVSWEAAAFAASAVALSFVVPVAPGGLGIFHGAVVLSLSLFSVPAAPALAFAIIAHAFQMGSVLVAAMGSLLWQGISLRTLTTVRSVNQ